MRRNMRLSIAGIDLDESATARLLAKFPVKDEYEVKEKLLYEYKLYLFF